MFKKHIKQKNLDTHRGRERGRKRENWLTHADVETKTENEPNATYGE